MWIAQNAVYTFRLGPFVDATDGFTAEAGLTIGASDVRLSKNGAAFAAKSEATAPTHDENGWYVVDLDGADTDSPGPLIVAVHVAGARPVHIEFQVDANLLDISDMVSALINDVNTLTSDVAAIPDAILDASDAIEAGLTWRQAMRGISAALFGKVSAAGTATETVRNAVADDTDRLVYTVDASGNRTAVTTNLT